MPISEVRPLSGAAVIELRVGNPAPKYLVVCSKRTYRFLGYALRGAGVFFVKLFN